MKQTLLSSLLAALLLLPPTGAALHAQTAADTLRHRPTHGIGIDLRPGYVFPTAGFFRGATPPKALSTRPWAST